MRQATVTQLLDLLRPSDRAAPPQCISSMPSSAETAFATPPPRPRSALSDLFQVSLVLGLPLLLDSRPHDIGQSEQCGAGSPPRARTTNALALRPRVHGRRRIAYRLAQPCEVSRADDTDLLAFHDGDDPFTRDIADAGRTRKQRCRVPLQPPRCLAPIGCSDWLSADAAKRSSSASFPSASTAMSLTPETGLPSRSRFLSNTARRQIARALSKAAPVRGSAGPFLALSVVLTATTSGTARPERMRTGYHHHGPPCARRRIRRGLAGEPAQKHQ